MRLLAAAILALALVASAGAVPPFAQLAKLYVYDASAPLGVREAGVTTSGGIAVHDLSYASPVRGRVPAYLVLPPGNGPFPVVLYAPGSGGTRDELLGDAQALAARGVAGFLFTPPHIRRDGPLLTTCNAAKDVGAAVEYVKEERRALDVIAARPELDSKRVGYVGHAAPAALLIQNGSLDAISPRKDVLALYNAASDPKSLRWYRSAHHLPAAATAFRDGWLLGHLR